MKIKYLAHSSFLITSDSGARLITDPYETSNSHRYGKINEQADVITVTHEHSDHNNVAAVKGSPKVVRGPAQVKDFNIRAVSVFHDAANGKERGKNTIFCITVNGVNVCHLGDLGHLLTISQVADVGKVDVLMVPVGGFFTIDAGTAGEVAAQLKARIIIPMHYKTEKSSLPIKGVEEFTRNKTNVTISQGSELEIKAGQLPPGPRIIVLKPSL